VANCFGCKKKLGVFLERGDKKWIIKNVGKPPEGMDDKDVLCHDCLELIRDGRKLSEDTKQSGGFITEIPEEEKEKIGKSLSSSPKKIIIIAVVCSVGATLGVLAGIELLNQYTYDIYLEKQQHLLDLDSVYEEVVNNYRGGLGGQGLTICNQSLDYVQLEECLYKHLPSYHADNFIKKIDEIRSEYEKTLNEIRAMEQRP